MIWLLFKNCRKKKNKGVGYTDPSETVVNAKEVLRDVLTRLDALRPTDDNDDGHVYITDGHFDSLSVTGSHESGQYRTGNVDTAVKIIGGHQEDHPVDGPEDEPEMIITTRCTAKVSEILLKTLQCPPAWTDIDQLGWNKNIINLVQNKYGNYNTMNVISSAGFSFEK